MPAARRTASGPRRGPTVVAGLGALGLVAWGGLVALSFSEPLSMLWGPWFWGLAVALGLSALAALAVLASASRSAGTLAPGAPLRLTLLAGLMGLAVLLFALQPARDVTVALTAGLTGGLAAVLVLTARALPRRLSRSLDLTAVLLIVLVLAAEAVTRVWDAAARPALLAPTEADAAAMLARHRLAPGTLRFGFPINSRGDYDAELDRASPAARDRLVVAIGDSFANGVVPHHYHYTTEAERHLAALTGQTWEVYNMGAPAIGPREYLHLIRHEALALEPDAIVVGLFTGNDLVAAAQGTRPAPDGPARWFGREHFKSALALTRLVRLWGQPTTGAPPAAGSDPVRDLASLRRLYPWIDDVGAEQPFMLRYDFARVERQRAGGVCNDDDAPYDATEAVLAEMAEACGDIPLLVMVIPDEFQVEPDVWELVVSADGADLDRDRPHRELTRRLAAPAFTEAGGHALHLLEPLRAVPPLPDGRRHVYHLHDTHFNARGNRAAGQALGAALAGLLSADG